MESVSYSAVEQVVVEDRAQSENRRIFLSGHAQAIASASVADRRLIAPT
jgi:hypothetical protein